MSPSSVADARIRTLDPNQSSVDISYSAMEFAHEAKWRPERCFCMNTLRGSFV
jgi:hypothetical protein